MVEVVAVVMEEVVEVAVVVMQEEEEVEVVVVVRWSGAAGTHRRQRQLE